MEYLTLKELEQIDRDYFVPNQICGVLGCDPHYIRLQAQRRPEALGFNVIVMGSRIRIPKIPFLQYIRGSV